MTRHTKLKPHWFHILLSLADRDLHGTAIMEEVLERTESHMRLWPGKLYGALKELADAYTDLFDDMLRIFDGKQVENHYVSDISLVLHPLPRVPLLVCYWRPDDGMESSLNVFFDSTAEENLHIEAIYMLSAGLVTMLGKLALRHG